MRQLPPVRTYQLVLLAVAAGSLTSASAQADDAPRAPAITALASFCGLGYNAGYHARFPERANWSQRELVRRSPWSPLTASRMTGNPLTGSPISTHILGQPRGPLHAYPTASLHAAQPPLACAPMTPTADSIFAPADSVPADSVPANSVPAELTPAQAGRVGTETSALAPEADALPVRDSANSAAQQRSTWLRQLLKPETSSAGDRRADSSPSDRAGGASPK